MNSNKRARIEEPNFLFKNQNHLANLNNMRLSGQFCDVTIKVNDREFLAHKNILAANLKYFQMMFSNSFEESKQDVITMKDVEETYLESFISFAYTGEILLTDKNVLGLLKVANYLGEDGIKEACIEFFKKHLKAEEACWVYQVSNAIECLPLKNLAKQTILSQFSQCSQTLEYFDFDCESLKRILQEAGLAAETQQSFFEGIVRWILHDVESRKMYVNDLLSFIDVTKLTSDYLIKYTCEMMKDRSLSDLVQDIMLFYNQKMQKMESLMIIGVDNGELQLQFYDFTKNKWCRPREIGKGVNQAVMIASAVFENNFYYLRLENSHFDGNLTVFNPTEGKKTIVCPDNRLLRGTAICACTKSLYFCGGQKNRFKSNQVLRYDIQNSSFEMLPPLETRRNGATAIIYQDCLYVLGGHNGLTSSQRFVNSVEKYDPSTKRWTTLPPMCEGRILPVVAVLNEKLYACGGHMGNSRGKSSAEVYDPTKNKWQLISSMNNSRHMFAAVAHEGKLFAIGGDDEKTVEVYDPIKDQWQIDHQLSSGLQIKCNRGGLVPSSCANGHFT